MLFWKDVRDKGELRLGKEAAVYIWKSIRNKRGRGPILVELCLSYEDQGRGQWPNGAEMTFRSKMTRERI